MMSSAIDLEKIATRLKSVSRDDGSIDAAQVKVIGLDAIREAAGPRWARMRERVCAGSLDILSRHVSPDDVIIPAGDGFLVVLAEGLPGHHQERCRKMQDALLAFYLGEEALATLRPEVTSRSLSADGFADLMSAGMHPQSPTRIIAKTTGGELVRVRTFSLRERQVVGEWFCPVKFERGARRLAYDADFILDGRHRGQDFLELDIALLDEALTALAADAEEDRQRVTGLAVHATTMQTRRSRQAYLAALSSAPESVRKRAIITIAEIEKGTPLISIAEWCCGLRAIVSRVCLDFHYADHAISSIGNTGAWAAGFHLPIYSGAQKGPRAARTLDQLRFWSKTLRAQGMRLAVNGFQEPDFLNQAQVAGVDLATSDVLWPFKLIGHDETSPAVERVH